MEWDRCPGFESSACKRQRSSFVAKLSKVEMPARIGRLFDSAGGKHHATIFHITGP